MANYKPIGVPFDRTFRNDLNDNFKTLDGVASSAKADTETAKQAATSAAQSAQKSQDEATSARISTERAEAKATETQAQIDNLILENGDSSAEVVQARGGEDLLYKRLDKTEASIMEIGINVKTKGLGNNPNRDDGALLQSIFNNANEGDEILVPYGTILYFKTGVTVNKMIRFRCHGEIKILSSNISAFNFTGKNTTHSGFTENQDWYIRKITGNSGERTQTAFKMQHNMFSRFKVDHAFNLKYVVHFKGLEGYEANSRIGENIWEMVRWRLCDKTVYFEGASGWSAAPFAEGNQFINGFMSGANHGIYVSNFIKAGGMLITCGIDNLEVSNSSDFFNECDTTKYTIGNLLLLRFIRLPNCQFRRNDMVLCPNFGAFLNGDLRVNGNIESYDLAADDISKTNGVLLSKVGYAKVTSNNPYPFVDFRTTRDKDYDSRITMQNGKDIQLNTGGSGNIKNSVTVKPNGIYVNPSGINRSIPANTPTANLTFASQMPDNNYGVNVSTSWFTKYTITNKTVSGFSINFETPPTKTETYDYQTFVN